MERPIGLTKDVGWQFGIRRTIPSSKEKVWDFMFSNVGEQIWMQHVEKEFTTFKPTLTFVRNGDCRAGTIMPPYSFASWVMKIKLL